MPFGPIPYFNPWMLASPTLPDIYWKVKSREQLIAQLYCIVDAIKDLDNQQTDEINEHESEITELQGIIDSIQNGEYFDKYIDGLASWIDENLQELVARQAAYCFPTFWQEPETGAWHVAMVIPNTWDFLRFKWVFDESDHTFRIALEY